MIDADGFRPNIGIMICNEDCQLLWARRIQQDAWQFPQGGIKRHESPEQALFRELHEEVGLDDTQVKILGRTQNWLNYRLPKRYIRADQHPTCIGQRQLWYLLRLNCEESAVKLDHSPHPEFDYWRWVNYWYPIHGVVEFKQAVYRRALAELAPLFFSPQKIQSC
ncbi:MAG TPA: RNA pyrophosphohydrolase [Gammaproteobacteria bacterium]|nr:RNA pyrophosphohydrolase [Gammaproteobacteria bacterium]